MSTVVENGVGIDHQLDLRCSSCIRATQESEAVTYCVECQEYFCSSCVHMHNRFTALANHHLIGTTDLKSDGSISTKSDLPVVPTERCRIHTTKLIDNYCGNHDIVGCSACFMVHFKNCEDIHYIPDIVATRYKPEMLAKVIEAMNTSKEKLQSTRKQCEATLADLVRSNSLTLGAINEFRCKINRILDDLEKATIVELNAKCEELSSKIEGDMNKVKSLLQDVDKRLDQLKCIDKNKSELFVCQNIGHQSTITAEELCKTIGKSFQKTKLFFRTDSSITSFLSRLTLLGKFSDQKALFGNVKEHHKFDISVADDKDQCNIWGSCVLGNGYIILADNGNNKLKVLHPNTNKVIDFCPVPASPRSLCTMGNLEAAVTLANKSVCFVKMDGHLIMSRSFHMNHNCFGIAVSESEMFISDGSQNLYVYNLEGELLWTLANDPTGQPIFSESRDITVSDDQKKIHVADSRKGIITIDKEGNVLWKHACAELKGAYGVCTDSDGLLLVSGILSHNVMQLSQHGDKPGQILSATDGLQSPVSVCFDKNNSRLLVSKTGSQILAFDFD